VLHNVYKTFANGAEVFSPDWSLLLEIWHESTAQLIADGVPQERFFPSGGVYHVLQIWKSNRTNVPAYKDLPRWAYDPAFDTHKATCSDGATSGGVEGLLAEFGMEDMMAYEQVALDDEDVDVSDNEDTPYSWLSDTNRYKVLASSAETHVNCYPKGEPNSGRLGRGIDCRPRHSNHVEAAQSHCHGSAPSVHLAHPRPYHERHSQRRFPREDRAWGE
jgi:hypothetical protein